MKKHLTLLSFIIFITARSFSQTIPVGSYAEEVARRNQLLGISTDKSSFTQHPLNSAFNTSDTTLQSMVASKNLMPQFKPLGVPFEVKILPFSWLNDYTSKLPAGYNNSSLYPNKGYQTRVTGGIYLKAGILQIQFKPEYVYADNSPFLTFANVQANYNSGLIPAFFTKVNGIDAPERFGPYSLEHIYAGQSKITLAYKNIEAGVSTENLWWGPATQNSIMMSNSAPGFMHWTFNSVNPVETIAGSFEWQIIGGILKQSGFLSYDPGKLVYDKGYYIPKPDVTRYLSAFTANWQPKWLNGFYLGVSAYDYTDRNDAYSNSGFFKRIFPVFAGSSNTANEATNTSGAAVGDNQDFAYAFNVRQLLPAYNAELYFEYARNDRAANIRDLTLEPEHSAVYTVGGKKLFNLNNNQFLQLAMELTHLQLADTYLVREDQSFYTHSISPRDGYTNQGRYIGAGIGPGGNSLMIDLSYIKGINSAGIKLERQVHDNDLYFFGLAGTKDFSSHWVDLSSTFYANWKISNYMISAEYTPISTLNYEYLQNNDISNKHARITLTAFIK
jgi:hypothetical protein